MLRPARTKPTPTVHQVPAPTPAPPHPHPALRQGGGVQAEQLSDRNAGVARWPRDGLADTWHVFWPTDVRAIGAADARWSGGGGGTDLDTVVTVPCGESGPKLNGSERSPWLVVFSPRLFGRGLTAPDPLPLCSSRAQGVRSHRVGPAAQRWFAELLPLDQHVVAQAEETAWNGTRCRRNAQGWCSSLIFNPLDVFMIIQY